MDIHVQHKGMTLVEVMVAIAIFTMAMSGFTFLFMDSLKVNSFTIEEGTTAMLTSRAVSNIASDLRRVRQGDNGDFPIVSVSDFDLKVYVNADTDDDTERVHYFLDGDLLRRGVSNPIVGTPVTYPAGDESVTTVATYVVNVSGEPLFSYYNKNYPGDTANNPLSGTISVGDIRLIRIWIRMNIDPIKAPNNINIQSFAELRNLNDY
ncbi:MAG: prepilin-type N-terminal cleavage/methylation domain-containing protein [Candidatus Moranbacteria bacterium]|nr:prepilin-type N-terminal cleavage/methylation domain-containing protein [Candidatus Moranbacteria bacterium]